MHTATISSKFQISIPEGIREELNIVPWQEFIFISKDKCLVLIPKRTIKDIQDLLEGANTNDTRDRNDRI